MDERHSYLLKTARQVAKKCEEPSTVVTVMALLFICLVVAPVAGSSLVTIEIINAAVAAISLVLVLLLHYAHRHDIRTLQARLASLAASTEDQQQAPAATGTLTPSEITQIRELLAAQPSEHDDVNQRSNRDKRPSLF